MRSDLWYDEVYSYHTASLPFDQMLHSLLIGGDTNPPLYTVLLHFWLKLGNSETHIKSLSLLFGLASIGVMFRLGKLVGGTQVAFIASFLLAVSGSTIRYSLEARPYAPFLFLTLLSTFLYLSIMKKSQAESPPSANRSIWVWYGVVTTLALYTHWFSLLLFPLHTLALLIYHSRSAKPLILHYAVAWLIILCCCLPLLPFLDDQINLQNTVGGFSWCGHPNRHSFIDLASFLAGGKNLSVVILIIFLLPFLTKRWTPSSVSVSKNHKCFFAAYVLVPVILVAGVSFSLSHYSFFVPRYFLPFIVGVHLLVAALLAQMNKKLTFLFLLIFAITPLVRTSRHWRNPERAYSLLAAELGKHSERPVLHLTPMSYYSTLYYRHEILPKQKVAWSESIGLGYVLNYNLKGAAIDADEVVEIDSGLRAWREFYVVNDPIDGDPTVKRMESRLKNEPGLLLVSEKEIGNLSLELFRVQEATVESK
jgi:hypothetical protein